MERLVAVVLRVWELVLDIKDVTEKKVGVFLYISVHLQEALHGACILLEKMSSIFLI
jgi:hypothetical protein